MPIGLRPAARTAPRRFSTMSRRAATSRTRWAPSSSAVGSGAKGTKSMTAFSSGIGSWSCAWKRTAASSSARLAVGGTVRTRTTIFWLATPTRTRLPRPLLSRQRPRSASDRASTSTTSPSRRTPGSSGAIAARSTEIRPLTRTSAAAMPLGSMSSPIRFLGGFAMWRTAAGGSVETGDPSGYRRSARRLEAVFGARRTNVRRWRRGARSDRCTRRRSRRRRRTR